MLNLPTLTVHRSKRAQQGYPWIYSNELSLTTLDKELPIGGLVRFATVDGVFLGIGTFNRHALISGRVLSHHEYEYPNKEWFYKKFLKAKNARERIYKDPFYRWVHAESDGLAGLIIDRYGVTAVIQVNTAGMELLQDVWIAALKESEPLIESWVIRKDSNSRQLEHIDNKPVEIVGTLVEHQIIGQEGPVYFIADVLDGQKTGWFYDQRENRALIARWINPGDTVLDLFTHTGSFALYAAHKGAVVDAVDRSALALELGSKAALLNQVSNRITWHQAQVFHYLEQESRFFDMVIVDPPAFVKSKATLNQGIQGYIKTLTLALKVVKPGGLLCFTSCSHLITPSDILDICIKAGLKTKRQLTVLAHLGAGFDHPVRAELQELTYLKGVLVAVD